MNREPTDASPAHLVPGIEVLALPVLREITPGDNLAEEIVGSLASISDELILIQNDIVVVSQKIVSKAEGRTVRLADVHPSDRARDLANRSGRDPRLVQVVLDCTRRIVHSPSPLICETHSGLVCANAGVDLSNSAEDGMAILLPEDADESARRLRREISTQTGQAPGVLITDTFGRPWRLGQTDVAIGSAGVSPIDDWSGRRDGSGRALGVTSIAVADSIAAMADLARSKDSRQPVVVVRGLGRFVTRADGPGARALQRPSDEDAFR